MVARAVASMPGAYTLVSAQRGSGGAGDDYGALY